MTAPIAAGAVVRAHATIAVSPAGRTASSGIGGSGGAVDAPPAVKAAGGSKSSSSAVAADAGRPRGGVFAAGRLKFPEVQAEVQAEAEVPPSETRSLPPDLERLWRPNLDGDFAKWKSVQLAKLDAAKLDAANRDAAKRPALVTKGRGPFTFVRSGEADPPPTAAVPGAGTVANRPAAAVSQPTVVRAPGAGTAAAVTAAAAPAPAAHPVRRIVTAPERRAKAQALGDALAAAAAVPAPTAQGAVLGAASEAGEPMGAAASGAGSSIGAAPVEVWDPERESFPAFTARQAAATGAARVGGGKGGGKGRRRW